MPEDLKKDVALVSAGEGFGVYVHWPFCAAKCPYCDFNSHVRHNAVMQPDYLEAYRKEISHFASLTGGRTVTSIFFGGGTPSLMEPETVREIIECIGTCWTIADGAEISLEANPSSVEAGRFSGYRQAGVNRVSLGIQSLNDDRLRFLGRLHDAKEAVQAIETAAANFERYSLDFIYATPGQEPVEWHKELQAAISLAAGHLSLYQLTFEPGTPFNAMKNTGKIIPSSEKCSAELYELTQEITAQSGLDAYEISNHASKGEQCRHNLVYWRGQEYAGIGPGAHGRIAIKGDRTATECIKHPETWRQQVLANGHGLHSVESLQPTEQADEYMLMGLRLSEGLRLDHYHRLAGHPVNSDTLQHLQSLGLVETHKENRIRATPKGRLVLNSVVAELADRPAPQKS